MEKKEERKEEGEISKKHDEDILILMEGELYLVL